MFSPNTPNMPLLSHQMKILSPPPKKSSRKLRRTQTDPASCSLDVLKSHARIAKSAAVDAPKNPKTASRSTPRRCKTFDECTMRACRRCSNSSTCTATTAGSTWSHNKALDRSDHCGRMIPLRAEPGPSILKKTSASTNANDLTEDSSPRRRVSLNVRVSFDITETREYPLLFDDSRHDRPAMLTLGWNYQVVDVSTVQDFDFNRAYRRQKSGSSVRVWQPAERIGLLLDAGYQLRELAIEKSQQQEDEHDSVYIQETLKTVHPKKKSKLFSKVKKAASKTIGRTTRRRSMEV